ncbi:MAG: hypothetical protein J6T23_05970 [Elusimicrobia bacterium]|nr:hypothetical protein [Elusimicrobiota bacterium]
MRKSKNKVSKGSKQFIDSAILNDATYFDYLERLRKIALSMFEWVNLPSSMNAEYLEKTLFESGVACLLNTDKYGYINTNASTSGNINIYGLPTDIRCFSHDFEEERFVYHGFKNDKELSPDKLAVLIYNNLNKQPTATTLELFALRLYEAERSCDTNIKAQKFPLIILCDEKSRLTMENVFNQYDGNQPAIYGDKQNLDINDIKAIKTDAPFVADKLIDYKKEIWNEALTFLGINNIMVDKKERLVADEANSNNELINLNLQSYFAPRQKACEQFNELFGLTGEKAISVRLRSDLHNIIKNQSSVVNDYNTNINNEGGEDNG